MHYITFAIYQFCFIEMKECAAYIFVVVPEPLKGKQILFAVSSLLLTLQIRLQFAVDKDDNFCSYMDHVWCKDDIKSVAVDIKHKYNINTD